MKLPMIAVAAALLCHKEAESFSVVSKISPSLSRVSPSVAGVSGVHGRNALPQLRASEDDESDDSTSDQVGLPPLPSQRDSPPKEERAPAPVNPAPAPAATSDASVQEDEGTSYPINLPSPVLLASSMVMAISSTGSLFELTGGGPTTLGFGPTAALAAIGIPMSVFLIYAAILKGAAETEEDDKEYNKPRKL
ncbi:hypothetical protein ACHAWF_010944 [Thalassiosira exigua]